MRWLWVSAFTGTTSGRCGGSFALFTVIIIVAFVALDLRGQLDDDAAALDVDGRHHGVGERQQQRAAGRRRDLDDVAGAEVMHGDDASERFTCSGFRSEPDQVRMVVLVFIGGGQLVARNVKLYAV